MYASTSKEARLSVEGQAVDLALEDVGVVRHGRQVDASGVFAPRCVDRLVKLSFLVLTE